MYLCKKYKLNLKNRKNEGILNENAKDIEAFQENH